MLRHHSEQLSIPWGEMSIKEKDFILGGERNEPKAKGPHHHRQIQKLSAFQKSLSFGILLCSKGGESSISKMVYQNPLEH